MDDDLIFGLIGVAFMVGGYLFAAYVLYRVGRKFGIGSFGEYCIPIYNAVLLCRCARVPTWVAFAPLAAGFFLVVWPELGLIALLGMYASFVYLWGSLAERLGKSFWPWGLGSAFLGIPALILAFGEFTPVDGAGPVIEPATGPMSGAITGPMNEPVSFVYDAHFDDDRSITYDAIPELIAPVSDRRFIRFLTGEYAGQEIELPHDGIVIGRDPTRSNLVLRAPEISGRHVRVRVGSSDDRDLTVEDLGSTNGTYVWYQATGGSPKWVEVHGSDRIQVPCRIRLANGVAEFEIS